MFYFTIDPLAQFQCIVAVLPSEIFSQVHFIVPGRYTKKCSVTNIPEKHGVAVEERAL